MAGVNTAPVRVTDRCAGCGACLLTCPAHAIRPYGGTLLIRADLCTGCVECVEICPVDAIDIVAEQGGKAEQAGKAEKTEQAEQAEQEAP
ncbi:indolepyruvate ferredoxin oxidoreductase subunit alpha [Streptomyces sp. NBC_01803]|uniref:indolepyruvate ferredoxin oxidoreductase subunit alpha n=1 Tax=Streptomyces sp. NBC_01803 TaxID=2975946 RepID=UPI002DD7BF97|nr:4Fe-4S dicluster domain-containing protein [Streptomyces sp. NBC_01803]WSA46821.1 4Fe-4S binding protein [Streptomyces sp. NBC_01803]